MKNKQIIMWGIISIFFLNVSILASQSADTTKQNNTEPLELPNFVIEKVEQLSIKIGAKQRATPPLPLDANYLDSVNSFEKQKIVPLMPEENSPQVLDMSYKKGFIKGDFGRYSTAFIHSGYGINLDGYDLYADAKYEGSKGHEKDSDFNKFDIQLSSDYIAPDKYFIFGGSRSRTSVDFHTNKYSLYSKSNDDDFILNSGLYKRNYLNFDAQVISDGNFNGANFQTGAKFNTFHLESDSSKGFQNGVMGFLKIHNYWKKFLLAGNVMMDMQNISGNSYNFAQGDVSGKFFTEKLSISFCSGLQYARTTTNENRGGLLLKGDIEYRYNSKFTINTKIQSGLNKKSFAEMYDDNPYISIINDIDFAYDIINFSGSMFYHPDNDIGITVRIAYKSTARMPYFFNSTDIDSSSSFSVGYADVSGLNAEAEIWYNITDKDVLLSDIQIYNYTFKNNKSVPYIPLAKINLIYSRLLFDNFVSKVGIVFASSKYGDIANEIEIDSYVNISLGFEYGLMPNLSMFANIENLLNSNIYIWDKYKERSMYANVGLMWQF